MELATNDEVHKYNWKKPFVL